MTIKFEVAKGFEDKGINLPKRGTSGSAGYDFEVAEDVTILPLAEKKKGTLVKTGVKVKLPKNTYLALHPRSSLFNKKGLILANGVGVIDSDYYGNDDNDGHVMVNVLNLMDKPVELKKGEKIAQGIISHYFITNEDSLLEGGERNGGFGSTDK